MRDRRMLVVEGEAVIDEANKQAALIIERGRLARFITEPAWGCSRQTFTSPVPFEDPA